LTTYAIRGTRGSGEVCINGAAAHLVAKGDTVIVLAYQEMDEASARSLEPRLVYVDGLNRIVRIARGDGDSHNGDEAVAAGY
jgi:aspartate 1-decarboxylase